MDALELLINRQSTALLKEPAPNEDSLAKIVAAGMRVPDHACLTPWHFTIVKEQGLEKLSKIFVDAISSENVEQAKLDKTAKMPFRAPLIIIVSTKYQSHPKVPNQEQLVAAGCCVQAMQMASVALGYGAMWRTGDLSYNNKVKQALNIEVNDDIVGYLYIGTPTKDMPNKASKSASGVVSYL